MGFIGLIGFIGFIGSIRLGFGSAGLSLPKAERAKP
jgi:hypothetical protein